ncbi:MAG: chemotaxis protein CheA [Firmicutes bacterium]|jgi:two-component system chemotaxis sensor kinase CheA|nr:chemotaxis protein CheA [Bacillota bacterium]
MDMSQYLEIFIEESREHLDQMNQILLDLENNTEDLDLLNGIFRVAHTIKGMAGTMGFNKVQNLTHEMENVLHKVRSGEIAVSEEIIDILFECFDTLEEYIGNLKNTGEEGDTDASALVKKLIMLLENDGKLVSEASEEVEVEEAELVSDSLDDAIELEDIVPVLNKAIENEFNVFEVEVVLDENCMLKAARAFIVFNTLEQFGEVIKSKPTAEDIEDENFELSFKLIYITKLDESTVINEVMKISEIGKVNASEINLDGYESGSVIVEEAEEDDVVKEIESVVSEVQEAVKEVKQTAKKETKKSNKQGQTSKTVRVDIDRLDNLMNLVSELIIIKTRLEDSDSVNDRSKMNDAVEYLERITTSLHDAVMKVRMVPVERTFNRFPRMVRDLAKDLGKKINLHMSGEDTEVDRTVIDEIGDPLIHLIRNSIDHGIESPEERSQVGKKEAGTVNLRAYPDGNTVVIEVEDDGDGINIDRVSQKAINKGIITQQDLENMKQNEIVELLFHPGFSTAEKVTDLSGRGVGLDVVKTKIESLGGIVEVQTAKGEGSKFIIRLPLTLAIIQALMVNMGIEKYALPLNNIKEITTIKSNTISKVQDQEVVLYRDNTLPILRLADILEIPREEDPEELIVVVVRKGLKEAGLVVDSLIGQQEIVIKSLGKYLTGINIIAGATILGNGGVALIVDPNQLI